MENSTVTPRTDVKKYTPEEVLSIVEEANLSAKEAATSRAEVFTKEFGHHDVGCCGFGWTVVEVRSNTKVGKELQKYGFSRAYGVKGLQIWNPSAFPTQNIDIKEAGAEAFAYVMRKYNFESYSCSRMD